MAMKDSVERLGAVGWGRWYLATGLIALGVVALVYRDFVPQWGPIPPWVPARQALALLVALLMVGCGVALCVERAVPAVSRVLLVYWALWVVLLKVPRVVTAPLVEQRWLLLGESSMVLAAAWVLVARTVLGSDDLRAARIVFGLALVPVGLSHLVYLDVTIGFVPAWLPFRTGWAVLTGIAHIAAGLAVLAGVLPGLAAGLEAWMITAFGLLVWVPAAVSHPGVPRSWTGLAVTWTVGGGAWIVADSYRRVRWPRRPTGAGARGIAGEDAEPRA